MEFRVFFDFLFSLGSVRSKGGRVTLRFVGGCFSLDLLSYLGVAGVQGGIPID